MFYGLNVDFSVKTSIPAPKTAFFGGTIRESNDYIKVMRYLYSVLSLLFLGGYGFAALNDTIAITYYLNGGVNNPDNPATATVFRDYSSTIITANPYGMNVSVFDMQGRMITSGLVGTAGNVALEMRHAGSYLVQVGRQVLRIAVK